MHIKKYLIVIILASLYHFSACASDFAVIMERFYQEDRVEFNDSLIDVYASKICDNGSFEDIDYNSTNIVYWDPIYHLDRLITMSYAYTTPGNKYFRDVSLFGMIEKGVSFWYDSNLVSDNWWYLAIAEPQRIGRLFIALRQGEQRMSPDLEQEMLKRCQDRAGKPTSGAVNITDMALANIYQSLLLGDGELLHTSVDYIKGAIAYAPNKDGFQYDNSYHSHGSQLYIGGYGVNHLLALTEVGKCIVGTEYDFDLEQKQILSNYVLNTFANCIRGQVIQYNCIGRNIARLDDLKFTSRFSLIVKRMADIDPDNKQAYEYSLSRIMGEVGSDFQVNACNYYYPTSDFSLHVRPRYTFSVRMSSVNTIRPERGNGENLLGYYMGDGSTCLTKSGNEYFNIMPMWDWDKLPGITTPSKEVIPSSDNWGINGSAIFCGGVTDSLCGVSAFSYRDDNPEVRSGASKAWFMFDDKIVCLGAGLTSDYNLNTTIESCFGQKQCEYISNAGIDVLKGNNIRSTESPIGVFHNGVGYYFPFGGDLFISNAVKYGNWRWISNEQPDSVIKGDIFTLLLTHEMDNAKSSYNKYSYVILPEMDNSSFLQKYISNPDVEIIENSDSVQIVHDISGKLFGVVFYKECDYTRDGYSFKVSSPCILMLKDDLGGAYLCDPLKQVEEIRIDVKLPDVGEITGYASFANDMYKGITKPLILVNNSTDIEEFHEMGKYRIHRNGKTIQLLFNDNIEGDCSIYNVTGELIGYKKISEKSTDVVLPYSGIFIFKITYAGNIVTNKILVR